MGKLEDRRGKKLRHGDVVNIPSVGRFRIVDEFVENGEN